MSGRARVRIGRALSPLSHVAIHKPEKDQCAIYSGNKVGNIQGSEYQIQVKEKEETGSEYIFSVTGNNTVMIYADLRTVVIAPPPLQSSACYYILYLQPYYNYMIKT